MTSLHHAPVDDADGLAFGARDGVRLHKANLGGDAEEFLDAFLDALFALLEWNNPGTIGNLTPGGKILASLFQSVTLRTAGFASFNQDALTEASKVLSD